MNFKPLLISIICVLFCSFTRVAVFGQAPVKNYTKEWKQVEDLIKKELPKAALEKVRSIYQQAKKDNQDAQLIKASVYMLGLTSTVTDNEDAKVITDLEKEASSVNEPARSILNSLLAEIYWAYYQQHRYQLYNRTNTEGFKKDNIATWTADDFHKKISDLYLQSIKNSTLLERTNLQNYDAIIVKGNMRHLRPTLFDLLAHQALDYFKNDERDISRPAYAFQIDNASAFDPAADFIHHSFATKDSFSLESKALLLFQQLIAFHLNDAKPDALIDVDIERIEFVNQKGVQENKKELYLAALDHIAHHYGNSPAASQAWFLIAQQYDTDATTYQPYGDTTHRLDKLKAKEICEKILQQKDSSEGRLNCYNLLNEINQKSLQFSIEKVNLPDKPFRALIKYKNFSTVYLRVIKADDKLKNELSDYDFEKFWNNITAASAIHSWEQILPRTTDMQEHSAEIKVDAITPGDYLLLASTDKDFSPKNSLLGVTLFYVSNISYVNNEQNYFVLHRETGQPLVNAMVQVWEKKYDYKTSKYIKEKTRSYKTDDKGFFSVADKKQNADNNNFLLDITYKGERFFMNEDQPGYYYNYNNQIDTSVISAFLFTDRSIYRPGQLLFFKGIVLNSNFLEKKNNIESNYKTMIYLRNANSELIDSMQVTTNDYGSFSGKFQLPSSGLNGEFTLSMKENTAAAYVSVEEYKRPKFYVDYEKLKGSFKVNDSIKITGVAKAYAGNLIDGATVYYRVVRQPRFIYDWLFWRWWQPLTKEMEIAHGEAKTDKDGKFQIEFTAIPDLSIDKKLDPVFDYRVYADVTDINGETRSGESFVTAGYKSLLLNVNLPEKLPLDSLKNISITTTNMAGEFQTSLVDIKISKLKEEKRLIRNRYWQRPDVFVINKEDYVKLFPFDEYDNETDYKSWEKEKQVFEKADSVRENSEFRIQNLELSAGIYIVEVITTDREGQEVKNIKYIELYNEKNDQLNRPQYLWTQESKPIEPGGKATIGIGTSADSVYLIQQVNKFSNVQPQATSYKLQTLNNEKKTFEFTASEADRGGYGVNYLFVKNNRFYKYTDEIQVPWANKDLAIEYATFRDKTLPGSEEKWKVKITGYKNEKVAAEMLASMYDASLDQFKPHTWYKPSIWPYYPYNGIWNGDYDFSEAKSQQRENDDIFSKYLDKRYDVLFGNFNNYDRVDAFAPGASPTIRMRGNLIEKESVDEVVVTGFEKQKNKEGYYNPDVKSADTSKIIAKLPSTQDNPTIQIRKNFNETAFFFPDLRTDSTGAIEFSFTIPEALTKWKLQTLAHTKDLAFGLSTKEIVTQKQLMVQPNAPRFLREGDRMEFSAKIVNLTDSEFTGQAQLQLFNAATNQSVDGWFQNMFPNQYFTIAAGQSEAVKFPVQIPYLFNKALTWRVVARAGNFSDGEEDVMPVLTNKTLVTETLPLNMKGTGTKNFKFDKLLHAGESETRQNYALTVEYTSNPTWYAIQSLPYLMEYPYECAEQTWNRYYANSLASMIANSSPRIKEIFEQWKTKDTSALLSNLQKNQELKSVLLEETPWVLDAKSEEQQKKNIALLFDMIKMGSELNNSLEKLKQMQSENGGFVWFKGGTDDLYITQYIVTGIGHLKKLFAASSGKTFGLNEKLKDILTTALPYLDKKIKEQYDEIIKRQKAQKSSLRADLGGLEIQYLYMRSFFPEYPVAKASQTAYTYFRKQSQLYWTKQTKYMQGMIALALSRTGDAKTPADILRSLKETAIMNEDLGMYWKNENRGWFWYQAPIETQSLLIEAFQEISKDTKTVDDLKTWLLKNKQTTNWRTTKATAEACYALLLQGSKWLSGEPVIEIKLGSAVIKSDTSSPEAGTGYFKKTIEGEKINPGMGNILVTSKPGSGSSTTSSVSWGSVYWQYFEDLDKITPSDNNAALSLKLSKKLFVEKNTDRGPVLTPVNEESKLQLGDKIKVRIELSVDRDMEYVHMKDMRASCLEPVNVLSEYKWQDGLGYYESTKDASTNFFFSYLHKGTYVFEYPLFVTHTGNFSNGITTIQCMYAPEFGSHSEGVRINVEQ